MQQNDAYFRSYCKRRESPSSSQSSREASYHISQRGHYLTVHSTKLNAATETLSIFARLAMFSIKLKSTGLLHWDTSRVGPEIFTPLKDGLIWKALSTATRIEPS